MIPMKYNLTMAMYGETLVIIDWTESKYMKFVHTEDTNGRPGVNARIAPFPL